MYQKLHEEGKRADPAPELKFSTKLGRKYVLPFPISYFEDASGLQILCFCLYFPFGIVLMTIRTILLIVVLTLTVLLSVCGLPSVEAYCSSALFCRLLYFGAFFVNFDDQDVKNKNKLFQERKNIILTNHHTANDFGLLWNLLRKFLGVKSKLFSNQKVASKFPYSVFKPLLIVSNGRGFVDLFNNWVQDGGNDAGIPIILAGNGMSTHLDWHAEQAYYYFVHPVQVTPVYIKFRNPFGLHNRHISSSLFVDLLLLYFLPWTTASLTVLDPVPPKERSKEEAIQCARETTVRMCKAAEPALRLTSWGNKQKRALERFRKGDKNQLQELDLRTPGVMKVGEKVLIGERVQDLEGNIQSHSPRSSKFKNVHVVCAVEGVLTRSSNRHTNGQLLDCLRHAVQQDRSIRLTLITDLPRKDVLSLTELKANEVNVEGYFDPSKAVKDQSEEEVLLISSKLPSADEEQRLKGLDAQLVLINPSLQDKLIGVAWQIPIGQF